MRLSSILLVAAACAKPAPPQTVAPAAVVGTTTPDAAADSAPAAMLALAPTPTHRVLEWLVDVIAHRKGEVSRDEMAEYCGPFFLGPVSGTAEGFRKWATAADGAVLESLEVDDPTYVRAFLAISDHRFKLTLEIDRATSKMSYVRFETVR